VCVRACVRACECVRGRGVHVRGLPAAAAAGARQALSAFRSQKDLPAQGFGVSGLGQTLPVQLCVTKSGREREGEGGRERGMERVRRRWLHAPAR